jgi:cobalt transporter subunit CbtB
MKMSSHNEETVMFEIGVVSRKDFWVVTGIVMVGIFGLYALALDQGLLLSLVQGAPAFDMNLIHEVIHDTRHAAGFPCH